MRGSDSIERHDMFPDDPGSFNEHSATPQSATQWFQRDHILKVLRATDWNIPETARILDVSQSSLYNLIRTYDLKSD